VVSLLLFLLVFLIDFLFTRIIDCGYRVGKNDAYVVAFNGLVAIGAYFLAFSPFLNAVMSKEMSTGQRHQSMVATGIAFLEANSAFHYLNDKMKYASELKKVYSTRRIVLPRD
jgi:hypothetical protein